MLLRLSLLVQRAAVAAALTGVVLGGGALNVPAVGADPAPRQLPFTPAVPLVSPLTITQLRVQPGGREATVDVRGSEPIAISYTLTSATGDVTPSVRDPRAASIGASSVSVVGLDHQFTPTYQPAYQFKLTGLTPNTEYKLDVTVTNAKGESTTAHQSFSTLKQRARLTLDKIVISDDGDWIGDGEPTWYWQVSWPGGGTGACFPFNAPAPENGAAICQAGSYSEGTVFPVNNRGEKLALIFAAENFAVMPQSFTLHTSAEEDDLIGVIGGLGECIQHLGCDFGGPQVTDLVIPRDKEYSSLTIEMPTSDHDYQFHSVMYFRFETFFDNNPYPPNHGRALVRSNF